MASRAENKAGVRGDGAINGKRFAERIGVAHGTVKRWLHEGLPCERTSHQTWIDPAAADAWISNRYGKTIAFNRHAVVYLAARDDGAIKIGWTSDIVRRLAELRKKSRAPVQLLACFPGDKPIELRLHDRFAKDRIEGEWYRESAELRLFIDALGRAAA